MLRFSLYTLLLCIVSLQLRSEIRLVGSDLIEAVLLTPLNAYADANALSLDIDMIGTQPGMSELEDGSADLLLAALPDGPPADTRDYVYHPFAFKIVILAVNNENDLAEISLPQVSGIFAESSERYFTRWGELGMGGVMANRAIQPVVLDDNASVLLELFKHRALDGSAIKQDVLRASSVTELEQMLTSDVRVIAITDRPVAANVGRSLSVASGKPGEFAFDPRAENVFYGDYPIRLPFYLVYPEEKEPQLRDLLQLMYTDEFSAVVGQQGFLVLPANIRKRVSFEIANSEE